MPSRMDRSYQTGPGAPGPMRRRLSGGAGARVEDETLARAGTQDVDVQGVRPAEDEHAREIVEGRHRCRVGGQEEVTAGETARGRRSVRLHADHADGPALAGLA